MQSHPISWNLADEIRADLAGLPSRVVRRKIKETLEDARRLLFFASRSASTWQTRWA
jgi:hypothetical protein